MRVYVVAIPNTKKLIVKAASKRAAKKIVRSFLAITKLPAGTKITQIGN